MTQVRLTTEASLTAPCLRLGLVRDNSVRDLRRKIVQTGGDTGLLSFPPGELSMVYAQVFRCTPAVAPPTASPPPGGPGAPPPPPPGPPPPAPPGAPPAPPR
jgi:hypothetical protein